MHNPVSTYRIQFNKNFSFADAKEQVEYYNLLGIGSVYAAPVFEATPNSLHGYDVVNPHRVNPELGDEKEFRSLSSSLKKRRIGWIQDIVPNHMGYNHHNKWIWDVWEKGEKSLYASFFDIDWNHPLCEGKLMIPVLGHSIEDAINSGSLSLQWKNHRFSIVYHEHLFPVNYKTFVGLMKMDDGDMPTSIGRIISRFPKSETEPESDFLNNEWAKFKEQLSQLSEKNSDVTDFLKQVAKNVTNSSQLLTEIINQQHYELCCWKETEKRINYRRFFTVNDLICLRMNDKSVFDYYHEIIEYWQHKSWIDGFRIDHIDGLYNPGEYLHRLRQQIGDDKYLVVEKILEEGEELPPNWPVQGTSGYDFLGLVNNLLTRQENYEKLQSFYNYITDNNKEPREIISEAKSFILSKRMGGEWDNLTETFISSGLVDDDKLDQLGRNSIRDAIGAFLMEAPVYRLYSEHLPLEGKDRVIVEGMFSGALDKNPGLKEALIILKSLFLEGGDSSEVKNQIANRFFMRCMQFTGPLMAKGVEDTTMYRYNAFITHNEVGDAPDAHGITIEQFHKAMENRRESWPLSMNTTSTHDTKRGEDVRARLNVISEMPEQWLTQVAVWMKMNKPFKREMKGLEVPSVSEEYFIYQTMVGVMPFNQKVTSFFISRLDEYMVKSLREAKLNTNWSTPDESWEEAVIDFIHKILDDEHGFLQSFLPFQDKIAAWGINNSLAQLALKGTCPGVPDIYQGTELWDLSLVDPDNRRPVDYSLRHILLRSMIDRQMRDPEVFLQSLLNDRQSGSIKLWLTHRLLQLRKENKTLFNEGTYLPLEVKGKYIKHVMAFARQHGNAWAVTIVPLYLASIFKRDEVLYPENIDWKDTQVILPDDTPEDWHHVFSGLTMSVSGSVSLNELFKHGPVGLLHAEKRGTSRKAGVLLHVTSLPGKYSAGDFGHDAYRFIDFLKASGHSYWQVLPLTQTTAGAGWSPYSPPSAFAGNIQFISPDVLASEGLIYSNDLERWERRLSDNSDYEDALAIREEVTTKAWFRFRQKALDQPLAQFRDFCNAESYWLHDYALFLLFKELFNDKPWNEWPQEVVLRVPEVLEQYSTDYKERLDLEKFRQYLFFKQWKALKRYANYHGIKIIGDVPIYVSYDNADVWSHPELFKLHSDKTPYAVAGVPPDYFSETGQLWNMPVYNWDVMKKQDFEWWIQRLSKNLELFDLVRLDHFRGFDAYWEVMAGEPTAVHGKWEKAPGKDFFAKVKEHFPKMPFIAEDLGEIDKSVYKLRDEFDLPGMHVLQFSFGDDMPVSVHTPHNYCFNSVVYTGTHDNNTVRGWYKNELSEEGKKRLQFYTGLKPRGRNCHEIVNRLVWSSRAWLAIVPMQDILGLGAKAQMNRPSVAEGNWLWRLKNLPDDKETIETIRESLWAFGRTD
ncbi:malto-oligosyltrehalose synthase [Alkalitalea saponilacus]|nr:malto-oligosyltrehalose synthase [Alkalitalea saponilacus]ASB51169.1 malto-oligosyltrehalose synthase [Alkalitalea saponilacus]